MARALDFRLARPFHIHVTTLGRLFTYMCLCHEAVQFGTGQTAVTLYGWEGNCRSGIALAMHHRLSGIPTYRLQGDEHPTPLTVQFGLRHIYFLKQNLLTLQ